MSVNVFSVKYFEICYSSILLFSVIISRQLWRDLKVIVFENCNNKHVSLVNYLWFLYIFLVRSLLKYSIVIGHAYLTKYQLRLECMQNKFLVYAAFIFKLYDTCYDYTYLYEVVKIQSLHSHHSNVDQNFITALFNGLLDATDILSDNSFREPFYYT